MEQPEKVALDYNPKYKIHFHESIVYINETRNVPYKRVLHKSSALKEHITPYSLSVSYTCSVDRESNPQCRNLTDTTSAKRGHLESTSHSRK